METELNDISNFGIYEYHSNVRPESLNSLTDRLKHFILIARNDGISDFKIANILNMSPSQLHRFMNEKEEMPKSETS